MSNPIVQLLAIVQAINAAQLVLGRSICRQPKRCQLLSLRHTLARGGQYVPESACHGGYSGGSRVIGREIPGGDFGVGSGAYPAWGYACNHCRTEDALREVICCPHGGCLYSPFWRCLGTQLHGLSQAESYCPGKGTKVFLFLLCGDMISHIERVKTTPEWGARMEQQRVRIRDIAEELGLSTATVSNVIHGRPGISPMKR